jgi:hypothetical protein
VLLRPMDYSGSGWTRCPLGLLLLDLTTGDMRTCSLRSRSPLSHLSNENLLAHLYVLLHRFFLFSFRVYMHVGHTPIYLQLASIIFSCIK